MGSLGDAFPEKLKNVYAELKDTQAESQVECGSVIFLFDREANKHKFHVIVGFDGDKILAATVRINSEINENFYDTDERKSMCHPISPDVANFLDHDSYIPCDKVIEWDRNAVVALVKADPSVVLGVIPEDVLEIVQYKVSTATTISNRKKKKYNLLLK